MAEVGREYDAVVVGAGFAGMYMLYKLRKLGFTARVVERGKGVGGTWYWNRYPGARCDVESLDYQYSFSEELAREWEWSERYATQPEILKYAEHVAERFDLYRDIQFETSVTSMHYDDGSRRWKVGTDRGDEFTAKYCISAVGCLSTTRIPEFKGLDAFTGTTYHTGSWPHEGVDFTGQDVVVIGTGSSGIQAIPIIAQQAKRLTVFQRTPNYSLPANNALLTPERVEEYKSHFAEIKAKARESAAGLVVDPIERSVMSASEEERRQEFETRWGQGGFHLLQAYNDLVVTNEANDTVAEFVRSKIREIVKDPETAEKLSPRDYPLGTKRLCIDTDYYATFNRDNVALVDVREEPIEQVTPGGVKTAAKEYPADSIVFATGFDAMTGTLLGMDIRGRGGVRLNDVWEAGPRTYLGVSVAGFPNLFIITGPGSPSVLSNMIISIEQHVDWISDCMAYMREKGLETIEADEKHQDEWVDHVNAVADLTLYPQANSWYLGANIPGKPRVFMPYVGGVGAYRQKCDQVAANGYEGFQLKPAPAGAAV